MQRNVSLKNHKCFESTKHHVGAVDNIQGYTVGKIRLSLVFSFIKHIYLTSIEKQVLTTCTNLSQTCFLGTIPVVQANENPCWHHSRDSNSRPYACQADALPHDHRHHIVKNPLPPSQVFHNALGKNAFENIVGKGKNAGNQKLHFYTCCLHSIKSNTSNSSAVQVRIFETGETMNHWQHFKI